MNATALQTLVDMTSHLANLNLGYLGICVTILIFIGGFIYFVNVKPLKDKLDKQEEILTGLKKEVSDNLFSSKQEIKNDLKVFEKIFSESIFSTIEQKHKQLMADFETRNAIFEKDFSEKFDNLATKKDTELRTILESETKSQVRDLEKSLTEKIDQFKTERSSTYEALLDIKRDMVDLQIEYHLGKGQVGAAKMLIEKIELCIKKGWGIVESLLELEKYIKERKMPSYYLKDLQEALSKVPKEQSLLAENLLKLANEKAYNPRA